MFRKQTSIALIHGLALAVVAGSCLGQDQYERSRYNLIVERSPFGADAGPIEPDTSVMDSPQVKQALQELRLCFLMESPATGEVRAGFQNLKAKKGEPKSVILMEGESFRSMKLVKVNMEDSTATLEYLGKLIPFELSKGSAAKAAPTQPTPRQPSRRFGGGFRPRQPTTTTPQPEEPELTPEEREQRVAEIRAKLQEAQMDIIRKGQPPLPMPLTQEMDDQLVAEGVLPPSDAEQEK